MFNKVALTFTLLLALAAFNRAIANNSVSDWEPPSVELVQQAFALPDTQSAAKWLWFEAPQIKSNCSAFYRKKIQLPEKSIRQAIFFAGMDDTGDLYLHGEKQVEIDFPQPDFQVKFHKFDLSEKLRPGENLLACVARNGAALGGLILRGEIEFTDGAKLTIVSDSSFLASSEAPDGWNQPGFDDSTWLPAMAFGDVGTHPWVTVSDVFNIFTSEEEKQAYNQAVARSISTPSLPAQSECIAEVVWRGNMAAIAINGQPRPPVLGIIGANPWMPEVADQIVKFSQTGIEFIEYQVATNRMFKKPGEYDFAFIDRDIRRILHLHPEAKLFVSVRFDLFSNWLEANPDELIGYATGASDADGDLERKRAPSMASKLFRKELQHFTTAFVQYLSQQEWFKRTVALRVSHAVYSEWHYYGMSQDMPDTGKAMTMAFRQWLKNNYATDKQLQLSWNDQLVTLDTAQVPNAQERRGNGAFLRNPQGGGQKVMDYYRCHSEVVADTLLLMAATAKKTAPKLLIGAYYGYIFGMPYPAEGLTIELDRVLSSPHIDFLSAPHCYAPESRYIGGNGLPRTIVNTFQKHRKLHFYEADTRTHIAKGLGLGNAKTVEDSVAAIKRDFAVSAFHGCGIQLLEFAARGGKRCWFNDPEIFRAIRSGLKAWETLYANRSPSEAEIAVVFHPEELLLHGFPETRQLRQSSSSYWGDYAMHALLNSGYAFKTLSLRDYLAEEKSYRVVVFLNAWTLNQTMYAALQRHQHQSNTFTIWCYAPGLISADRYDPTAMKNLTGIELAVSHSKSPLHATLNDGTELSCRGSALSSSNRGKIISENPRVYCTDPDVEILATYTDNRQTALAIKKLPSNATVVWSGLPILRPDVWRQLFQRSGLQPQSEMGFPFYSDGAVSVLHTAKAGSRHLSLPGAHRDLFGATVRSDADGITVHSDGPQTWLIVKESK